MSYRVEAVPCPVVRRNSQMTAWQGIVTVQETNERVHSTSVQLRRDDAKKLAWDWVFAANARKHSKALGLEEVS